MLFSILGWLGLKPKKDLLACDPQLSAAVLLLKLQLAGGVAM